MKTAIEIKRVLYLLAVNYPGRLILSAIVVFPISLSAQEPVKEDPFQILLKESRPLDTIWQTDYSNKLELGLAYTGDENVNFGKYTGLNESSVTLLGKLNWQQKTNDQTWVVQLEDIGLESATGLAKWQFGGTSIWFKFDSTIQTQDNSASTPFTGSNNLSLGANWKPGITTAGFTNLEQSSRFFTRDSKRQKFSIGFERDLNQSWAIGINAGLENKSGTGDIGAAIYTDAANPIAVLLPLPIDYRSTELSLNVNYSSTRLQWMTRLYSSNFSNNNALLQWQNPYDANFGAAVDYPAGVGALALAPDNQYMQLRSTASLRLSQFWRLHLDASVGKATQDDNFANYTINPSLTLTEGLPRTSLGGEIQTNTFSAKLNGNLTRKLSTDFRYRVIDRENDSPRDGYLYIRGDGGNQPDAKFTVYNTNHGNSKQTAEINLHYRLPGRTKLSANYQLERVVRENAAVESTEEVRAGLTLSLHPFNNTSMRFNVVGSDLAADRYQWDQSYFALLDTELINETADYQRYLNHPLLSQYHLSNRESRELNANLTQVLSNTWQVAFDVMARTIDYDKSVLGLLYMEFLHSMWSLAYLADDNLQFSLHVSYDELNSDQNGRSFGGGIERNAFDIYAPIAQASDPARDWQVRSKDRWVTAGFNVDWWPAKKLKMEIEYRFVDTKTDDQLSNGGAVDLDSTPLPRNSSRMHHLKINSEYALRPDLSFNVGYQYYRDNGQNWSKDAIQQNSINKVLNFGDNLPNEVIHYISSSVIYRW